ncbi:MAG: J domain-containing protein [Candidatus Limnocylindrales bacterium]|jgi:curved DNA-binding protein CbpA
MAEQLPDFDLYATLGLEPGADAAAVRVAYREAVRTAHPDVAGDATGTGDEATKRLNIARDWLTDPGRRQRYDEARGMSAATGQLGVAVGDASTALETTDERLAGGPGRGEAVGCLEVGWWLLLLTFAALIFAVLLLIVADG